MTISRRTILKSAAAGVAATAVGAGSLRGVAGASAQTALGNVSATGTGAAGTTLAKTVLPGQANASGYRPLVAGPGEPYVLQRAMIAPGVTAVTNPTIVIAAFAHLSDLHVVDDQSPLRVEFLDHLAQPGPPHFKGWPTDSAYRPHEFLSTQVVDAMARSIRSIGKGPATNVPLSLTIVTGDTVDNAQFNETRWYIDLLDGGKPIVPNSGDALSDGSVSTYTGYPLGPDSSYWHPSGEIDLHNTMLAYGFTTMPGLMTAARRPFTSTGLGMPWYAAYGNHDAMVQGNLSIYTDFPFSHSLKFIAVNGRKPVNTNGDLPDKLSDVGVIDGVRAALSGLVWTDVPVDPRRQLLSRQQFIQEHFNSPAPPDGPGPTGHGFTTPGADIAYYAIPSGATDLVQYIALDSTNTDGGTFDIENNAGGCIDDVQFNWLESRLKLNSARYISASGALITQSVKNKLFVVFCHHTIDTMTNLAGSGKHSGRELQTLLLRFPNVILLANGHTHRNQINEYVRTGPALNAFGLGGFWEVSAASHIDWPMQSRIMELAVGGDTISIFTTVVDIDAPLSNQGDLATPKALASLARELAVNDPQERLNADGPPSDMTKGRRGVLPGWRNAQLLVPAPFTIRSGPTAFVNPANTVSTLDLAGSARDTGIAVWPGTGPSIATDSAGGWMVALQDNRSRLWTIDFARVAVDTGLDVQPGTSPGIAHVSTGGYETVFVGKSDGLLYKLNPTRTDVRWVGAGLGVAANTSPAIAADNSGGWQVAFHAAGTDQLWTWDSSDHGGDTGLAMKPGTNPAIAHLSTGGYEIVFIGPDGLLYKLSAGHGDVRWVGAGFGVEANTGPSIAADANGGWKVAFNGGGGQLWTWDSADHGGYTGLTVAPGSGPSIVAAPAGGFEIIFQNADGALCKVDAAGNNHPTTAFARAQTTPASAGLLGAILPPPPGPAFAPVPDVQGKTFTAATSVLSAAGFTAFASGRTVIDPTCVKKDKIAQSHPAPGTSAVVGSSVGLDLFVLSTGGSCQ